MFGSRWSTLNHPVFGPLQQLHNELNRLADRWGDGRQPARAAEYPALNLWEADDALVLEAEMPGVSLDDIEIYVTGHDQLTIKGERKPQAPEKGVQHRLERGFGTFSRSVNLPVDVDAAKVEARLENGVLRVRLPKAETAKPRKINIKG
jgi:HSP20 family protein